MLFVFIAIQEFSYNNMSFVFLTIHSHIISRKKEKKNYTLTQTKSY
jgi:hypothetical protein